MNVGLSLHLLLTCDLWCIDSIIDNKSLRLISEASESSPSKNDKDYLDNNLRGKAACLVQIRNLHNIYLVDISVHIIVLTFAFPFWFHCGCHRTWPLNMQYTLFHKLENIWFYFSLCSSYKSLASLKLTSLIHHLSERKLVNYILLEVFFSLIVDVPKFHQCTKA